MASNSSFSYKYSMYFRQSCSHVACRLQYKFINRLKYSWVQLQMDPRCLDTSPTIPPNMDFVCVPDYLCRRVCSSCTIWKWLYYWFDFSIILVCHVMLLCSYFSDNACVCALYIAVCPDKSQPFISSYCSTQQGLPVEIINEHLYPLSPAIPDTWNSFIGI